MSDTTKPHPHDGKTGWEITKEILRGPGFLPPQLRDEVEKVIAYIDTDTDPNKAAVRHGAVNLLAATSLGVSPEGIPSTQMLIRTVAQLAWPEEFAKAQQMIEALVAANNDSVPKIIH
jgi:hypothetical protein